MINLSAFVTFHATRTPEREALLYAGRRIAWAELRDRVGQAAAMLQARGIRPGDVVAVFMKNSAAFLELAIATSHLGGVFLPINYRLAREEVAYIVGNSGAKLLFHDAELAAQAGGMEQSLAVDAEAQVDIRLLCGARREVPPHAPVESATLFRLMYTSGTTDRPKGVMHSYENFWWKCMEHVVTLGLGAHDRLLVVGPLYHVGAFDLPGLAVLWVGGLVALEREFDPAAALAAIGRERLTGVWMAPVMVNQVLDEAARRSYDVASLRWCIGGGEKTPEQRIRAFAEAFPTARYVDAYGLTESCSGDTMMEAGMEIARIGSTGRATPHVEITIRDGDGRILPPGSEGEICLRGPKVTKGYWKDPEKTAASFVDGWFRTGDVGYLDPDGFLYLTDRKKDLIISGGENIASSEVERVLYQLPEVSEAAVIGVPDARWGERPVAVVVLRPGASLDLAAVEAHCRDRLARFKVPRELHLRQSLPRNPSGKVLKRVLREELGGGT